MKDAAIHQDLGKHLPMFARKLFLQRVRSHNTIWDMYISPFFVKCICQIIKVYFPDLARCVSMILPNTFLPTDRCCNRPWHLASKLFLQENILVIYTNTLLHWTNRDRCCNRSRHVAMFAAQDIAKSKHYFPLRHVLRDADKYFWKFDKINSIIWTNVVRCCNRSSHLAMFAGKLFFERGQSQNTIFTWGMASCRPNLPSHAYHLWSF